MNMQQNSTKVARTSRRTMMISIGALIGTWSVAAALRRFLAQPSRPASHTHALGRIDDVVRDGARAEVAIAGTRVLIARRGDDVRVLDLTCTHARCPLEVHLPSNRIRCACHGGAFDLDGNVVQAPPTRPLTRYEARIVNDELFVRIHQEST